MGEREGAKPSRFYPRRSAAAGDSLTARQAGYSAPAAHSTIAPASGTPSPMIVGLKVM